MSLNDRPCDGQGRTPPARPRWPVSSVVALTILGGILRFSGLGDRDFWFDESCTFIYVHDLFDWPEGSDLLVESTNLPYYFILRGWVALFGDSEAAYRSLSALLATLTIPVLGLFAGRAGGAIAGVVCAALVAFNPIHIHYAHEARAYAMWMFVLSVALLLVYEAARQGRWYWWALYGIVVLFCLHLHYFTVYWLPASAACLFAAERRGRALRMWLIAHAAVALLFMPYFFLAVWPAGRGGGSAWIPEGASVAASLQLIPRSLWAFMPAGGYPQHLRGLSILSPDTVRLGPGWLTAIARTVPAVAVLAIMLYSARGALSFGTIGVLKSRVNRRARSVGRRGIAQAKARGSENGNGEWSAGLLGTRALDPRTHAFLAGLVFFPLLLAWLYSVVVRNNYLVGRYDLVSWPAFMAWLALCLAASARSLAPRRPALGAILLCVPLLACGMVPISRMAALKPPATFHHERARRLADISRPGDLVIAFSYDRDYLLYYLDRAGFAGRIISYPSWLDGQIGWVDTQSDSRPDMRARLERDAAALVREVEAADERSNRVWLLADSLTGDGADPRGEINQHLIGALVDAGYQGEPFDVRLKILGVTRTGER